MSLHVDSAGAGRDLLLLHGWAMHGALWAGLPARLAMVCRVHVVDLPGHGLSADMSKYSLQAIADQVRGCLPRGATVLGWSLGALIALRLAHEVPEQVAGLVLIAATPCFCRRPDWPQGMHEDTFGDFGTRLDADPPATVRRFISLQAAGSRAPRTLVQRARALHAARPAARPGALRAGLDILQGTDLREQVAGIGVPTVLIHGDGDAVVAPAAARWLVGAMPGAALHMVADAGHMPFLCAADRVTDLVTRAVHG